MVHGSMPIGEARARSFTSPSLGGLGFVGLDGPYAYSGGYAIRVRVLNVRFFHCLRPLWVAISTGRRNTCVTGICWGLCAPCARPAGDNESIEHSSYPRAAEFCAPACSQRADNSAFSSTAEPLRISNILSVHAIFRRFCQSVASTG